MKEDGGPAFPRPIGEHGPAFAGADGKYNEPQQGMSLRDWFAGQIAAVATWSDNDDDHNAKCARNCYTVADAMLKARSD